MSRYRVELTVRVVDAAAEELEAAVFDRPATAELVGELAAEVDADTPVDAAADALKAGLELLPGP